MTSSSWPPARQVRTLIVDDHAIFLEGLQAILLRADHPKIELIGVATSGVEALQYFSDHTLDLLILDLDLPDRDGMSIIQYVRRRDEAVRIVVLTQHQEANLVQQALDAGANGYLLKSGGPDELVQAIQRVIKGERYVSSSLERPAATTAPRQLEDHPAWRQFISRYQLTKREVQVLQLLATGLSSKAIAASLYISDQTVGVHRKHILRKLKVTNTAAVVRMVLENQLL